MSDGLEWTKDATKEQVVEVLRQKEAVIKTMEGDGLLRVSRDGFKMLMERPCERCGHARTGCTGKANGATFWCDQHFAVGWVGLPCTESPDYHAANLEVRDGA